MGTLSVGLAAPMLGLCWPVQSQSLDASECVGLIRFGLKVGEPEEEVGEVELM